MAVTQCDGVSQSFFGDLAAEHLCQNLSNYLLTIPTDQNAKQMHEDLFGYLNQLSIGFREKIETHSIDHIEPAFLRGVLETKRHLGSEAVFSSLLLDKKSYLAMLVWAGDSRIRVWKYGREITWAYFSEQEFLTQERWSSHKGIVGQLHLKILSPEDFDQLILYSDGFAIADNEADLFQQDNIQIESLITRTKTLAGSDDISFFQMTSSLPIAWHTGKKNTIRALNFDENREPGKLFIEWANPPGQNTWELATVTDLNFSVVETTRNSFKVLIDEIPQAGAFFAVRAVNPMAATEWSDWSFYKPPQIEPAKSTQLEKQRYRPVYQTPAPVDPLADREKYEHYQPRPEPVSVTSNKKWQISLAGMILLLICVGSFVLFSKGENKDNQRTNFFTALLAGHTTPTTTPESSATDEFPTSAAPIDTATPEPPPDTPQPDPDESELFSTLSTPYPFETTPPSTPSSAYPFETTPSSTPSLRNPFKTYPTRPQSAGSSFYATYTHGYQGGWFTNALESNNNLILLPLIVKENSLSSTPPSQSDDSLSE
jgi:hypothetical protein